MEAYKAHQFVNCFHYIFNLYSSVVICFYRTCNNVCVLINELVHKLLESLYSHMYTCEYSLLTAAVKATLKHVYTIWAKGFQVSCD